MLADKCAAAVGCGKYILLIEGQSERSGMCAQGKIRNDGLLYQFRFFLFHLRIFVLPPICIWPPIKSARFYAGQVIRNEIVSKVIPFINGSPECSCSRCPCHADGISYSGCIQFFSAAIGINFKDTGAPDFMFHSMFADITCRPY